MMGDIKGFKKYKRATPNYETVEKRIAHYEEFDEKVDADFKNKQAARCMDCGVPFCHSGCPLGNKIPDFNEAVFKSDWKLAFEILMSTNNFPEFTGRICPAPCESSCVLGINSDPVSIEFLEKSIIEKAFAEEWVKPNKAIQRTGKKVVVVGSGPAGLAAADQLNKAGHQVEVHEKNTRVGGLLRYGIPDFKLEKQIIDRRVKFLEAEGIQFICNSEVGKGVSAKTLQKESDAMLLCGGSTVPRDLKITGRDFKGIYFAMEYLEKNNKRVAGYKVDFSDFDLKDKNDWWWRYRIGLYRNIQQAGRKINYSNRATDKTKFGKNNEGPLAELADGIEDFVFA
jgi:glutamate synthase (NADPH/NADH) small chain